MSDRVVRKLKVGQVSVGGFGGNNLDGGVMRMTRGSLVVTNSAANAYIRIGDPGNGAANGKTGAQLILSNTPFVANHVLLTEQSTLDFDGISAAAASQITGTLDIQRGSVAQLRSGTLSIGTVKYNTGTIPNTTQAVHVAGGTITVGHLDMNFAGGQVASSRLLFRVSGGNVTIGDASVGYAFENRGDTELQIAGGNVTVTNGTTLGHHFNSENGAGTLTMTGGKFQTKELFVGAYNTGDGFVRGAGYYNQSGGTSTITGTLRLVTQHTHPLKPAATRMGSEEFVVGEGATMEFTGAGVVKTGSTAWMFGDTPGDLDFSGTFKFDPASGVTAQSFLVFSPDMGTNVNASGMVEQQYGVGAFDLTGLDGSEMLTILASGKNGTDALYIYSLLGQDAGTVTDHLDSTLNLYYFVHGSDPGLNAQTFNLDSGGRLIPLFVPEPTTMALMAIALAMFGRRNHKTRNPNLEIRNKHK